MFAKVAKILSKNRRLFLHKGGVVSNSFPSHRGNEISFQTGAVSLINNFPKYLGISNHSSFLNADKIVSKLCT